jgi:DNA-binding IscR family transcriptional regulator
MPGHVLNEVVSTLEAQGLVLTAEDDSVAPGRDLATIRLASIMDAIRHAPPSPRCPLPRPIEAADAMSRAMDQAMRDVLGERTLRELLATDAPDGRAV